MIKIKSGRNKKKSSINNKRNTVWEKRYLDCSVDITFKERGELKVHLQPVIRNPIVLIEWMNEALWTPSKPLKLISTKMNVYDYLSQSTNYPSSRKPDKNEQFAEQLASDYLH